MSQVPPWFEKEKGKKKAGSCLRFCLPLSFTKESGEAVEAPESPQLRYITGSEQATHTEVHSKIHADAHKHPPTHKQQPPNAEAADAFERELKQGPQKRLHLSQQLNLSSAT